MLVTGAGPDVMSGHPAAPAPTSPRSKALILILEIVDLMLELRDPVIPPPNPCFELVNLLQEFLVFGDMALIL